MCVEIYGYSRIFERLKSHEKCEPDLNPVPSKYVKVALDTN